MSNIFPAHPFNRLKLAVTLRASEDYATSFCEKSGCVRKKIGYVIVYFPTH